MITTVSSWLILENICELVGKQLHGLSFSQAKVRNLSPRRVTFSRTSLFEDGTVKFMWTASVLAKRSARDP